jgi:hypothetical protein
MQGECHVKTQRHADTEERLQVETEIKTGVMLL